MSKLSKWLAAVLIGLLVLAVGLALFFKFYFTGEKILALVKPPLEKYLHRQVSVAQARIGLRGFSLEGLVIKKQTPGPPLLKGEQLELHWKPLALLRGRIEIESLAFNRVVVTVIRQPDGSLSISDLLPAKAAPAPAAPPSGKAPGQRSRLSLFVSLLAVDQGRLTFIDRSRKPERTLQVANIRSRLSDLSLTTPIHLELQGELEGKEKGLLALKATANLAAGSVKANLDLKQLNLAGLLSLIASSSAALIHSGTLNLAAMLEVVGLDRIATQGSLTLTGLQLERQGELGKATALKAGFELHAVRSRQNLRISALDVDINGQNAQIQGQLSQWYKEPQLQFTLSSSEIRLDEILPLLPAGDSQQQPAAATAPPSQPGTRAPAASRARRPSPASASPAAARALDVQGEIHLGWLWYRNFVARNVACKFGLHQGRLRVQPLAASLYGGRLDGMVTAGILAPEPPFQSHLTVENVLLDEIVQAFRPGDSLHLAGNLSLNSTASGKGAELKDLRSRTSLKVSDADLGGHPLITKLAALFQAKDLERLHFSEVRAEIGTAHGIATIKKLLMQGPIIRLDGSGTAGLLDQKLNLRLLLRIPAQYVGKVPLLEPIVAKITDSQGLVELPVRVAGTFSEPQYRVDERWLKKRLRQAAKKPLERLEQKLLRQLPLGESGKKQLEQGLKQLFQQE